MEVAFFSSQKSIFESLINFIYTFQYIAIFLGLIWYFVQKNNEFSERILKLEEENKKLKENIKSKSETFLVEKMISSVQEKFDNIIYNEKKRSEMLFEDVRIFSNKLNGLESVFDAFKDLVNENEKNMEFNIFYIENNISRHHKKLEILENKINVLSEEIEEVEDEYKKCTEEVHKCITDYGLYIKK